jgi:chaperonin GroES
MKIEDFQPCGDKVLIKLDPEEEKTPGGIIKPQTADEFVKFVWGTVVAVSDGFYGQGVGWVEIKYKPGDRVMYQKGQPILLEDWPGYALIMEAAILAKEKK